MFFRSDYRIRNCGLVFSGTEEIRITLGGNVPVVVMIRALTESERTDMTQGSNDLWCEVSTERTAPQAIVETLQAVAARRRLPKTHPGISPDIAKYYRAAFNAEGRLEEGKAYPAEVFPQRYWEFERPIGSALFEGVQRAIRMLRWTHGTTAPDVIIRGAMGQYFSLDGEQWSYLPGKSSAFSTTDRIFRASHVRTDLIEEMIAHGQDEPLGHQLYREAESQRSGSPRSAIVIGIAAAEIGFKECVADLVPGATWLVENLPSPPLDKMLTSYLPQLPARLTIDGKVKAPPKTITAPLREGVALRNTTTHSFARAPLDHGKLQLILNAVRDLLWLLDYYRGMALAADRLSPETSAALGLGEQEHPPETVQTTDAPPGAAAFRQQGT